MLLDVFCLFIQYKEKNKTENNYISYFSIYNVVPLRDNYLPKNKNSYNFAA